MTKVPPPYADLGKSAKDLFEKGYSYGFVKFDLKTKSSSGVEFTTKGSYARDSGKICASMETKFKKPENGLTFTEKWTTDSKLSADVAIEDQLAQGSKVTFCTSYGLSSKMKTAALKIAYKRDYMNLNLDTDFNFAGPTLQGSAVIGHEGWLGGYQFAFDTAKSKLTKNVIALGYNGADLQLLTSLTESGELVGSIFQALNKNWSTGIQLAWASRQNFTTFGVAAKYDCDGGASLSAKVNNTGQIGFGWTQKMADGIKLNLSSLINGKYINSGGHQLGIGLEFEV